MLGLGVAGAAASSGSVPPPRPLLLPLPPPLLLLRCCFHHMLLEANLECIHLDLRRGVQLLRSLQDEIDDERDPDLNDAVVKLLAVFQSRLFKALVGGFLHNAVCLNLPNLQLQKSWQDIF